jgi:hypothetical protein
MVYGYGWNWGNNSYYGGYPRSSYWGGNVPYSTYWGGNSYYPYNNWGAWGTGSRAVAQSNLRSSLHRLAYDNRVDWALRRHY